jgi:hypothetical protein
VQMIDRDMSIANACHVLAGELPTQRYKKWKIPKNSDSFGRLLLKYRFR